MENKIKMVVFDMAGTTINENNVVYKTVQKTINQFGFNVTLEQVLAQGAGKEKLQAIKSVLVAYTNNSDENLPDNIYNVFVKELADAYTALEIQPQPGVIELFNSLRARDILITLNTGYNRQTAETIINKLNWQKGREFDELVTATEVNNNRPNPDMILYAMNSLGIDNGESVIKVGDSIIDIEEGKNASCRLSIGITTGAHTCSQLQTAEPDHIIDTLLDLIPIIDRL